ncbi:hypothetical protein [Morganella morganii IS15]|nr:hypothetical protein CSB69_3973 [Morganella morganii]EMP52204.1 hypothetical protein C790_04026 [Morganella morganii SC01]ETO41981.1 hypothetical protein X965_05415 [Morganella sp. EGD-HP17]CDK64288.1 hypothetical protein [Morganella morganii IS15]
MQGGYHTALPFSCSLYFFAIDRLSGYKDMPIMYFLSAGQRVMWFYI